MGDLECLLFLSSFLEEERERCRDRFELGDLVLLRLLERLISTGELRFLSSPRLPLPLDPAGEIYNIAGMKIENVERYYTCNDPI